MRIFHMIIVLVLGIFSTSASWGLTKEERIAEGAKIFFNETFYGNGRTCASCHHPDFNTQLGVEDIAELSPNDPVFTNVLMDLTLFKSHALVLTHHDGFDKEPTFRSIPDLFGAYRRNKFGKQLLAADPSAEVFQSREITRNAVKDHMSKSLDRIEGIDFRFPTQRELNRLVVFINSLRPINTDN